MARGYEPFDMSKRKMFSAVLAVFLLFCLFSPPRAVADDEMALCVVDWVVPILEKPDGLYEVDEDGYLGGEDILGVVVYGNHILARPTEASAETWLEILDPDGGDMLGYIERSGVEPLPAYERFEPRQFLVVRDDPVLLLQPGKDDGRYRLSKFDFALLKGEIVFAFGRCIVDKAEWLLLGFSTSVEESDTDGGIGMRYAWAKAADLTPLSDYAPDYAKNDPAWIPARLRNARTPFYRDGEYLTPDPFAILSGDVRERLRKKGFRIDPAPIILEHLTVDDLSDLYAATGPYVTDFVTTDACLHVYHLLFSQMLQDAERGYLTPTLRRGLERALAALDEIEPTKNAKASYDTARDMLAIPLALLTSDMKNDRLKLSARAQTEMKKILAMAGRGESAITGTTEDYTQYRPRGHYVGVPELERYFVAVSFLGNAGLELLSGESFSAENVRTAAFVSWALDAAGAAWDAYEAPIDFLVGTADDGSIRVYREIVRAHVGSGDVASRLADDAVIEGIASDIRTRIAGPRIRDRETGIISKEEEARTRTAEFRISGKRFTFDAYALNQLTSPRVGSDDDPRNLPEGTDVMAVLGSRAAASVAEKNFEVLHYRENLERLKGEIGPYLDVDGTAYSRWLAVLRASFGDSGSKQVFYRAPGWQWKKLMTASASWAELKHDTVLYAKQGGAEMGGGGEWIAGDFAPPTPRGYVEPDPQTFAALADMTNRILQCLDPILEEWDEIERHREKFERFGALCASAERIAGMEVRDEPMTLSDYDEIKYIARAFTDDLLMLYGNYYEDPEKLRMALVSDVATDFVSELALHVASGTPRQLLVFVNDRSGGPRVARGYVYSYYEFARPLSEGRMTDQEWREIAYDPARTEELSKLHPAWYGNLYED
ncbi:DUF3160 domain-containing protein [Synergistaceae bacterium OttesenSCG-928-I11]|nr:DUF3160 domain-containing protein [Synergistaceae bacterium OttesenSCG-928-I11]